MDDSATAPTKAVEAPRQPGLGAVLVNEHLLVAPQGFGYGGDGRALGERALEAGSKALRLLARSGISAVLDTTTIECGRDAVLLRELDAATGVRVLCCTGLSSEDEGVSRVFRTLPATRLAELYVRELLEGIAGTELRAAAVVVEPGAFGPFDQTALLAAAFAHAETGAPVLVRAVPAAIAAAVDRLVSRGVEPERLLALGVDSGATSLDVVRELARRGVQIGITAVADESELEPLARAALAAYALRAYGPDRVCVGTGAAVTEPEGGSDGAEALRRFREHVAAFGAGELLDEALAAGPQRLLEER